MAHEKPVVQMKLGKLRGEKFHTSLERLLKLENVPIKTSFKMRAILKAIKTHVEHHDDVQKKLIEEFSMKKDGVPVTEPVAAGGERVLIDPAKRTEFDGKYRELSDLEVDLHELKVEDLGVAANQLKPEDFFQLEFIIE